MARDVRQEVLSVRPGITSTASVLFRDEETLLDTSRLMESYFGEGVPSKLRLDQLYVRHRLFWLDLDILFWTLLLLVLVSKIGPRSPGEERLFSGPVTRLVTRYVGWFSLDMLVTFVAIAIVGAFWRSLGSLNVGLPKAILIAFGFAILYSLVGAILGVTRIIWSHAGFPDAIDLLPAVGIATVLALLINHFWTAVPPLPAGMIILSAALAYAGFIFVRHRHRILHSVATRFLQIRGGALGAKERVLIVGYGESGQFLTWWLYNGRAASGLRLIGYVDDDYYK